MAEYKGDPAEIFQHCKYGPIVLADDMEHLAIEMIEVYSNSPGVDFLLKAVREYDNWTSAWRYQKAFGLPAH